MIHNNEKKDKAFLLSANDTRERVFLVAYIIKTPKKMIIWSLWKS